MTITNQTSFGLAGVNIYEATTEQKYALGTRTSVNYGSSKDKSAEVVYIKAAADLTAAQICELPLIAGTDSYIVDAPLTKTISTALLTATGASHAACVPAATLISGEYGWAFVKGQIPVDIAANSLRAAKLSLTSVAGRVSDDDTDFLLGGTSGGAFLIASQGGAAGTADIFSPTDLFIFRNV